MKRSISVALLLLLFFSIMANPGVNNDSTHVNELKEIVVEGETYRIEGEKHILFLSKENRNFGTNALDAISSLNRFKTTLDATTLQTINNENVFILINGVPSEGIDLRTFKGKDIKNVEYYQQAPAQYMVFTTGPIINVVLKKSHEAYFGGYFNTKNAVNTGFGTNQVTLSYRDSLNQMNLNYFGDYRNIHNIIINSKYNSSYSSTFFDQSQLYKGDLNNISASYQRFEGLHLFNAKLSLKTNPRNQKTNGVGYYITSPDEPIFQFSNFSNARSRSRSVNMALYYIKMLSAQSSLSAQIVGNVGDSYSESELNPNQVETFEDNVINTVRPLLTQIDNDTYAVRGSVSYTNYTKAGTFSGSALYNYAQLNSSFKDSKSKVLSHKSYLYAGYSNFFDPTKHSSITPCTTNLTAGLAVQNQHTWINSYTQVSPYIQGYIDWWPQKLKGFTTQLTLSFQRNQPEISLLSEVQTNINYDLVYIGNPILKNWTKTGAKVVIGYFPRTSRNRISVIANIDYRHKPIATVLCLDGQYNYITPTNLNYTFNPSFYLNGSWYPVKWLEVSPYIEYYMFRFNTPNSKVRKGYLRYGGRIAFLKDSWSLILAANSPTKTYTGDFSEDDVAQYAVQFQYKYRNWALGTSCNFRSGKSLTSASSSFYHYSVVQKWKPLYYLTQISIVYSFSVGRARRHQNPSNNEDLNNTGLNEYIQPQMH